MSHSSRFLIRHLIDKPVTPNLPVLHLKFPHARSLIFGLVKTKLIPLYDRAQLAGTCSHCFTNPILLGSHEPLSSRQRDILLGLKARDPSEQSRAAVRCGVAAPAYAWTLAARAALTRLEFVPGVEVRNSSLGCGRGGGEAEEHRNSGKSELHLSSFGCDCSVCLEGAGSLCCVLGCD